MKPQISIPTTGGWVSLKTLSIKEQEDIKKKIAQVLENAIKMQIKISMDRSS